MREVKRIGLAAVLAAVMLAGGCGAGRRSLKTAPLGELPDGGRLLIEKRVLFHACETSAEKVMVGPLVYYQPAGGEPKVMATLIPAPGSPGDPVDFSQLEHGRLESASRKAWLVRDGRTVGSFDLQRGVAILGPAGHPQWAR